MNEILIEIVSDWWNTSNDKDLRSFLTNLSGDKSIHEKLHVSDWINVFNYANINAIHADEEAKNYLLKEVCGELAEQVLASKHGVSPDELFDEDGNFYEQFQDEFNRFYDQIEEKITDIEISNQLN
jgi:hypothetical protein